MDSPRIVIVSGDLVEPDVDAIVNAATTTSCSVAESRVRSAGVVVLPSRRSATHMVAVGTGSAGFPIEQCARIMAACVKRAIAAGWNPDEIRFVLFGAAAKRAFENSYG
jgi:O-acetyl-ADP-ribose deacetylase (regulator of RNase III)